MSHQITIHCPECGEEMHLDCEWTPEDRNYGADADGNRGRHVDGYMTLADDVPDNCPDNDCAAAFTPEDQEQLHKDAVQACKKWSN